MDGRVRVVILAAVDRPLEVAVEQPLRVRRPALVGELRANERVQIEALLKRVGLGARVRQVAALIELLGDVHRLIRGDVQLRRGQPLELDC